MEEDLKLECDEFIEDFKIKEKMTIKKEIDKEKNINLTESEVCDLKRALNLLIEKEQDTRDYSHILNKLNTYYD